MIEWGDGNLRLLGLVSVGEARSLDQTSLRPFVMVPTTPACTSWNRPEEDLSSGKSESTHPTSTVVKLMEWEDNNLIVFHSIIET